MQIEVDAEGCVCVCVCVSVSMLELGRQVPHVAGVHTDNDTGTGKPNRVRKQVTDMTGGDLV